MTTIVLSPERTRVETRPPVIISLRPRDVFDNLLEGQDVYRYDDTFNPNNSRNVSNYVAGLLDVDMPDIIYAQRDYTFDDMVTVTNTIRLGMLAPQPAYLDRMIPIYDNVTTNIPLAL